jgi:broad specificity phosphatase PhoE
VVPTRIVLIRHGLIDTAARLCGGLDLPLSSRGRAELAALLGRPPREDTPDALFTSTLTRAVEVACGLCRVWKLEPERASWAREIDCGVVDGMPLDHVQRRFPHVWARNAAQRDEGFAWPGGETYAQFRARVLRGLSGVAARHPAGRVVVVTHAGVISQVLGVIKGRPACVWEPDRPQPLTATEVLWSDAAPQVVLSFNNPAWY